MDPVTRKRRIRMWVRALRSGRYKQGQNWLLKDEKYCCLGVACDVYDKWAKRTGHAGTHRTVRGDGTTAFDTTGMELPPRVQEFYNLSSDPELDGQFTTWLNDNLGKSFREIADLIEREYLK